MKRLAIALASLAISSQTIHASDLGNAYHMFQYPGIGDPNLHTSCLGGFVSEPSAGVSRTFDISYAKTQYDLDKFVSLNSAFAVRTPTVKAGANLSNIRETKISRYDVVLLAKVVVRFPGETIKVSAGPSTNGSAEEFFSNCGTGYVSRVAKVAEAYASFEVHVESEKSRNEFIASVSGKAGTYSASGEFANAMTELRQKYNLKVHLDTIGYKEALPLKPGATLYDPEDVILFMSKFGADGGIKLDVNDVPVQITEVTPYSLKADWKKYVSAGRAVFDKASSLQVRLEELENFAEYGMKSPDSFWPSLDLGKVTTIRDDTRDALQEMTNDWRQCATTLGSDPKGCDASTFAANAFKFEKENRTLGLLPFATPDFDVTNNEPQHIYGVGNTPNDSKVVVSIIGEISGGAGAPFKKPASLGQNHQLRFFVINPGGSLEYSFDGTNPVFRRENALLQDYTGPFCVAGPANINLLFLDANPTDNKSQGFKVMVFQANDDLQAVKGVPCWKHP
jgi:hypothetical protein